MSNLFQIATLSPGLFRPSIPIASRRAGGLGILDFEYVVDRGAAIEAVRHLESAISGVFGIRLGANAEELLPSLLTAAPQFLRTVILTPLSFQQSPSSFDFLSNKNISYLFEATSLEQARFAVTAGFDGVIAKGHEAGGRVADETTFILLQRFKAEIALPIWAQGGIGLHTAPACAAAGAAGIILDAQLALARESSLPDSVKAKIASMDGSETICLGEQLGETYRMYFRPGSVVVKDLQRIEATLTHSDRPSGECMQEWRQAIQAKAGWDSDQSAWLLGQDAAFADSLAKRFRTVGGILHGMRVAIRTHSEQAMRLRPLAEASPLAQAHGTRYPIMQGPMTRVSDVPDFAAHVAEGGGLPFLALALMRGPEVRTLLGQAQIRMGSMPWGVGVLGFVPQELRQEQMEVITEFKPPFALIAGGRPDQASFLEKQGIVTYLHVPSPGLLDMFVKQGARRFVFEGRECGGHVGPRTSFVLWNQMVDVLLSSQDVQAKPEDFHVVFAAGIHDALSAAMVSVVSAPLAALGVKVGALVGSAYLFTKEAVSSGAILDTFQQQAQQCGETVLLETGPGHSTRCVATPYASAFFQEKRRLARAGHSPDEIRMTLEDLNLGRLRIASKGLTRNANFGDEPAAPKLLQMEVDDQLAHGMYMIGQVAALRNSICTIEDLHRDISVEGSNRLQLLAGCDLESDSPRVETPSDVAVIGMSCVLPKAPDAHSYWQNILDKVDAITEVPPERWNPELYYDADPKAKDKIYSRWGGFLDDVAFDPMQYGMPPSTLRSIEPSQLLTLEVVRAALEDSGYVDRQFARERTSVILGAGGGAADLGLAYGARSFIPNLENLPEFQGRSKEIIEAMGSKLPEWTEDSFAGILTNVSAGRVANRFDLGGSNYTVDAACASSLAAVSLALKELEGHTSDMVIVGGIDTMQNPFTYLCFSKTHALSPRGRCRTFDETADGIAISEGIAVMVFKRLEDAERDGDRIYAVIKGAGSSSDGKDRGLTAPRPEGQARALRRAYAKAGFSPASVGLIEAHGTGTVAGDGAEVQALSQVFSEFGAERQGCAIGSVKSMIGHTKCSAGAAGLMKAALALHHKVLPPTLGVQKPNPRARFAESPFFVNTEPRPWLQNENGKPRRAGVSAFGFGGTNFHIVLEEYTGDPSTARQDPYQTWPEELFFWKGNSQKELTDKLQAWNAALSLQDVKASLRDLAFTAWKQSGEKSSGNSPKPLQLAIVANSLEDLRQKIALAQESVTKGSDCNDPRGIYFSQQPLAQEGKLAFLFPGQGSQYPHMLEDLLIHFPEMQPVFERATHVLKGKLEKPLTSYVFPPSTFSREEELETRKSLTQTNVAQPALGAAGMATFRLLKEFGIRPDMLAGHSYGEYVALAAAGVFDESTLIAVSEARGRFIVESTVGDPGTMAAVEANSTDVAEVLREFPDVCVANANAPKQTVVSGATEGVARVVERFSAQGITARAIPVACAFHSSLVAPAQAHLSEFLSGVSLLPADTTVFSNTTATPYPEGPEKIAALLVDHLVKPVEFAREIEAMYAAGARVFVEVGPRSVLTGLVERILESRPKLAVASNQSARPGLTQILHLLGQLAAQGVAVNLDRLFRGRTVQRLNLAALPAGEPVLSPSIWLVNGARAKPLKETQIPQIAPQAPRLPVPSPTLAPISAPLSNGNSHPPRAENVPFTSTTPLMDSVPRQHSLPMPEIPSSLDGVPQVMAQFQQMMARFLEAQQTIMLTYLGAENGTTAVHNGNGHSHSPVPASFLNHAPAVPQPAAFQSPATNGFSHTPVQPVSLPAPFTEPLLTTAVVTPMMLAEAPAKSGPDLQEITARLLTIVSDRTGYPLEMLDLNLDLEADLGIDSIKRVEILGTFQQSFAAEEVTLGEGIMEKLSGVRTLQGIVERVAEQLGSDASHSPVATGAFDAVVPVVNQSAGGEEIASRLLAIVSDRTGYPSEMLDLDLDLEADLGIDSIKRVEILGTFQQSFADMGLSGQEGLLESLSGVRTLRGILAQIEPRAADKASPPAPIAAVTARDGAIPQPTVSSDLEREDRIGRFTLAAIETEWEGHEEKLSIPKDRTILITDDGHGVAQALASLLVKHGHSVSLAIQHGTVRDFGEQRYGVDFTSLSQAADLIEAIGKRQGPLGGLIHLLPLSTAWNKPATDQEAWSERLQLTTKSLFHLAKAARVQLHDSAKQGGACLMSATAMGGSFMSDLPHGAIVVNADHGGVVGLVKTLALEWPDVQVKAVDLNPQENAAVLAYHLWKELTGGKADPEVGRTEGKRIVLQPIRTPAEARVHGNFSLNQSSVLLITGGARGIAARAAQHFAQRYQPTIVLVGRSPLPGVAEDSSTLGLTAPKEIKAALMDRARRRGEEVTPARVEQAYAQLIAEREVRGTLAGLEQSGARVQYHSVDVRDSQALGSLIDRIYDSLGRIDGVIHAAGVIEDKLIQDKTPDSFDRVFDTKVKSAFTLSKKLRPESLQFCVLFSSVSGRFGNRGQGDYAAANEVLNKLAVSLDRAWPSRVVAINWGPWDNGGMVSAEVREQFAKRGVELISPAVGLLRLEEELQFGQKGEAEVVIGGTGWLSPASSASRIFPLLGKAVVSGEGDLWEIYRDLDPSFDLYLNDHKIDGQPVLPLAIATEFMAEAVSQTWPSMQVNAVRDLRLLNGVVLENGPKTIRIVAKKQAGSSAGAATVAVEITTATKPHRAYYRGVVEMAERGTVSALHDVPQPPAALLDGHAFAMSIPDLYRKWLFHGPLFQGILDVESVGPSGVRAILASSRPADLLAGTPNGRWLSDPLVFDSALQLLLLWGRQHWDMTALPSGFLRYRFLEEPTGAKVLCELRLRPNTGQQNIHADIYFIDPATNQTLSVLEDMQGACSKALNRLANREAAVGAGKQI